MKTVSLLLLAVAVTAATNTFYHDLYHEESLRSKLTKQGTFGAWRAALKAKLGGEKFEQLAGTPGYQPEADYQDTVHALYVLRKTSLTAPSHRHISRTDDTFLQDQAATASLALMCLPEPTLYMQFGSSEEKVKNQTFGQVTHFGMTLASSVVDGVTGMAFGQSVDMDGITSPFINLVNQGALANPWFTMWMTADGGSTQGKVGGGVTYGNFDKQHCSSNVAWVPLISENYYQFNIGGVKVKGVSINGAGTSAIVDSSSSLIAGPSQAIRQIAAELGASYDSQQGLYSVSCTANLAPVVFSIAGNDYAVESKNYLLNLGGQCYLGFEGFGGFGGPDWILGACFIRQYCTSFDVSGERVGFAGATQ